MKRVITRILQIVGAWGALTIFSVLFDDIAYPLAIFKWGPLVGGGSMAILAALICLVMLISYERNGTDWLGVNVLEDIKTEGENRVKKLDGWFDYQFDSSIIFAAVAPFILVFTHVPSRIFLVVLWALKKNDVLAFFALNIAQDPFVATVFLRHGRFGGLTRRDWMVFAASIVFSNSYWILRSTLLIWLIKQGWAIVN